MRLNISAEQIHHIIETYAGVGCSLDECDPNHDDFSLVKTSETLEDWIKSSVAWFDFYQSDNGNYEGNEFILFTDVKMLKGDTPKDICVIDGGHFRYVYSTESVPLVKVRPSRR